MSKRLKLYYSNDIHSGFDYWPNIVGHVRKNRDALTRFLDLGDHADRVNPMTEATAGLGNIRLLNAAGVDYATLGNNEGVTFSKEMTHAMYEAANFPVLVANMIDTKTGARPSWMEPFATETMPNGIKVGYIGYTAPMVDFYNEIGWTLEASFEILERLVAKLRPEVDALIMLSHLGLFRDEEIAKTIPEIDIIIGAHTHHVLERGKRVGHTLITQAGKHGRYLGELNLFFSETSHKLQRAETELLETSVLAPDEATAALLAELTEEAMMALNQPAAELARPLPVSWQEVSEGGQLLCDELVNWCECQLGMMSSGVLLETLHAGELTYGDLHRICPHPINPCVVELTGAELKSTIERAHTDEIRELELKGFGFRGKVLGVTLFTGFDIELSPSGNVMDIRVFGEPLKKEKTYLLATLDMYTFGFLFPDIAAAKKKEYFLPEFLRDVLLSMVKKQAM
ncbi:bifunctional metallophosphatase/5'-nucleotidase [Shouchella shacheensis]|uniref:bifunctional metallophosphatase/5'-nucleotidase n=1 Tax=Shouchella shacheensis TaxID=1649580 RepID=UPI0007404E56|nr:bifunctional UDP-sugar hydrolase/5'-nucleotidase [Shouchella shacheensis]